MKRIHASKPLLTGLFITLVCASAGWSQVSNTTTPNETCAGCHDQETKLKASAHSGVKCAACHIKHDEYPHPEKVPKPSCAQCHPTEASDSAESIHGQEVRKGNAGAPVCASCHNDVHEVTPSRTAEFHRSVPETCGMCHDQIAAEYAKSIHGKAVAAGIGEAPVCTDCHGSHKILPKSNPSSFVHPLAVRDTCGRCHGDLRLSRKFGLPADRLTSFDTSFHGLASKSGSQTVANCSSCHGFHAILASSDPKSMTNPKNLAATCGACHPGAGSRFSLTRIHDVMDKESRNDPVNWAFWFYATVIPATIGFMLLHHGADFVRKMRFISFGRRDVTLNRTARSFRMHRAERIQHAIMAVSFIVLTWTGFALHYPNEWWSAPVLRWEANWPIRGTLHRIAGVVLIGVAAAHVITLIVNRTLRHHWTELFPNAHDVREAAGGLAYRLGLRRAIPAMSSHSYVEKLEYWAVIWGTAVMAFTGVLLWANRYMLAYLPKVWLDFARAVHFYEAVLAALSILVWHLYSVIFDPEIYPMDPAWWSGYSPRLRREHHHGD
ncbi:MAG: cytochrome b/b6 domain-containing protein [Bryobacterales bacterium]|nr:cytochrome b/b6 domain-containing protein [Bryobacterales bacterium]